MVGHKTDLSDVTLGRGGGLDMEVDMKMNKGGLNERIEDFV